MPTQPFTIIWQDDDLLVLNKTRGHTIDTVIACVRAKFTSAEPVHRLDRDTSGVLLVARHRSAQELLQAQFKERRVCKEYLALLDGNLSRNYARIESYLCRNRKHRTRMQSYPTPVSGRNCRYAASEFFVLQRFQQRLNLAKVRIRTGRTHQIRVHAVALGVPVLGDNLYHRPTQLPQTFPATIRDMVSQLSAQMLHAQRIEFQHPRHQNTCHHEAPPPSDFANLLAALANCAEHA